jgi:hypothetical protein
MSHLEVIRGFIRGRYRRGSRVFADESTDTAYSYGRHFPLLVRLPDGFLVNGNRYSMSTGRHQGLVLHALAKERQRYAVVPFSALTMAVEESRRLTRHRVSTGEAELKQAVSIIVASSGERWVERPYRKPDGTLAMRMVHTLGDSVVRVHGRRYISAVDETGAGRGVYFFSELPDGRPPSSVPEALEMLKPPLVVEAEQKGLAVRRQGEWFAIPGDMNTRRLMQDVRDGYALRHRHHVLGRDGHHVLTDAVIYKYGEKKGWVFARGTMRHTRGEHRMLALEPWSRIVRARQRRSYSIVGNFD